MRPGNQTRRDFLKGAVALLPAVNAPSIVLGAAGPPDLALTFAADLDRLVLPVTPSHLTLLLYEEIDGPSSVTFRAVIRLVWPPGERTRSIKVTAPDDVGGRRALLARAEDVFCKNLR